MLGKRGVIGLVVLLLLLGMVGGEEGTDERYAGVYIDCDNCEQAVQCTSESIQCGTQELPTTYSGNLDASQIRCIFFEHLSGVPVFNSEEDPDDPEKRCASEFNTFTADTISDEAGCTVFAEEIDDNTDNCGYRITAVGTVMNNHEYTQFLCPETVSSSQQLCGGVWNQGNVQTEYGYSTQPYNVIAGGRVYRASDPLCMLNLWDFDGDNEVFANDLKETYTWKLNVPYEYLCADDKYWHKCEVGKNDQIETWAEDVLYICEEDSNVDGLGNWKRIGTDADHDGYTTSSDDPDRPNDCADDPEEDDIEICQDVHEADTLTDKQTICTDMQYSTCAACINPGAREICGDRVNNDCRGSSGNFDGHFLYTPTSPDSTPDDCNLFEKGCEKTPGEGKTPEGEIKTEGITHTNIYEKEFSWAQLGTSGYCCGYEGLSDLGKRSSKLWTGGKARVDAQQGNYLCLKADPFLVGMDPGEGDLDEAKIRTLITGESNWWNPEEGSSACKGDWCWVPADGAAKFKVITLKPPAGDSYDVVSDSNNWQQCTGNMEFAHDLYGPKRNLVPADDLRPDNKNVVNRFSCFNAGDHYEWAECFEDEASSPYNNNKKGRFAGDGLYGLSLTSFNAAEGSTGFQQEVQVRTDEGAYLQMYRRSEEEDKAYFDFTGYNQLEFFVQFGTNDGAASWESLVLPLSLTLAIYGPNDAEDNPILYYSKDVLGDVKNRPLFAQDKWMHVVTKIPEELHAVSLITLTPSFPNENRIQVKNMYLSTEGEDSKICSGEDSIDSSSWLTSFDQGDSGGLSAEVMCIAHYGDDAWLGSDTDLDDGADSANCCGNDEQEYYAGPSAAAQSDDPAIDGKKFACWNSQVLSSGETVMNVEVDVGWKEERVEFVYPKLELGLKPITLVGLDTLCGEAGICFTGENSIISEVSSIKNTLPFAGSIITLGTVDLHKFRTLLLPMFLDLADNRHITFNDEGRINYGPSIAASFILDGVNDIFDKQIAFQNNLVRLYFEDPTGRITFTNDQVLNFEDDSLPEEGTILIKAELTSRYALTEEESPLDSFFEQGIYPIIKTTTPEDLTTETLSFPCSLTPDKDSCLFPLPGKPPYTLKNPHPELYDLYFVYKNTAGQEVEKLIPESGIHTASSTFIPDVDGVSEENPVAGNIKAKRVAQQVLYINKEATVEEPTPPHGFFACNAPEFVLHPLDDLSTEEVTTAPYDPEQQSSCNIFDLGETSFYCSPSVSKDGKTLLNQWSSEPLLTDHTGYAPVTEDIPPEELQLELNSGETAAAAPKELTHLTAAVPGRNLLSNADFEDVNINDPKDLLFWEIGVFGASLAISDPRYAPSGELNSVLRRTATLPDGEEIFVISLENGQYLRSERIPVPAGKTISLAHQGENTCVRIIRAYTQEGEAISESDGGYLREELANFAPIMSDRDPFPAATILQLPENAAYVVATFSGTCTVQQPSLQILDETPAPYSYAEQSSITHPRSGLACCPETYCWNGYACIAPMEDTTVMVEHISSSEEGSAGKNYRCIDGAWTQMPRRFDWNNEKQGFCQKPTQCFVLSSAAGADTGITGSSRDPMINPEADLEYEPEEGVTARTFFDQQSEVRLPRCLDAGDFIMDNYCEGIEPNAEGIPTDTVWTSRTKFLAADLLAIAEQGDEYSLYCSSPASALLELDDQEERILGEPKERVSEGLIATGEGTYGCFDTNPETAEQDLIPDLKNSCVNSICILKNKEGKVIFGTTLNRPLEEENSFVDAMQLNRQTCLSSIIAELDYTVCMKEAGRNLWYQKEKSVILFSKEISSLQSPLLQRLLEWISEFLGREEEEISAASTFAQEAKNYRDIYLLKKSGKEVHAVIQALPRQGLETAGKYALVAEYQNFKSPLCQYMNEQRLGEPFNFDLLAENPIACTRDNEFQRAEITLPSRYQQDLFKLWPQLTGKLRVE